MRIKLILFFISTLPLHVLLGQSRLHQGGFNQFDKESFDKRIHSLSMFVDAFNQHLTEEDNKTQLASLFDIRKIQSDSTKHFEKNALLFIEDVITSQAMIATYGPDLVAQVSVDATYKDQKTQIVLFLQKELQAESLSWVIRSVKGLESFLPDERLSSAFISPNSSDMSFIGMVQKLNQGQNMMAYTHSDYCADYLSLMLYAISEGSLVLGKVRHTQLLFTAVDGWVFNLEEHQEVEENSGWLISVVTEISDKQDYYYSLGIK